MDLLYQHAKYGGDRGLCAGCRPKSVMFLSVCLSRFCNDEDCDNRNAMKQCNFQNNYGISAYVCSCAHIFNFFCGTPKFSNKGKFIPKIAIFRDF